MTPSSPHRHAFLERLARGPLICDGAMGTQLYTRGHLSFDRSFEELNASRPDLVRDVHLDYIRAGAEMLETNTFTGNRLRLEAHGLEGRTRELNVKGATIAREARRLTGTAVWVAGAVGPTGRPLAPLGPVSRSHARAVFQEQVEALVEGGVDLIMLETFPSLAETVEAVHATRRACDLPIVAQMTFTQEGRSPYGDAPRRVVQRLREMGVEVVGANCSVGSEPMLAVMEQMAQEPGVYLSAQPNAGFPQYVGGRYVYVASPEYMAEQARRMIELGVTIIGGCCGTTPDHIAALREVAATPRPEPRVPATAPLPTPAPPPPPTPPATVEPEPTALARKLARKFVVTVEVDPPKGFDISPILRALRQLQGTGLLDAANVADSPRAQGRMSALAASSLVQSRLGLETIMHLTVRHRNLLALHSDLLGAHALGVRNLFVVQGDPPSAGDYPEAAAISDITPTGLIRMIKGFNQGVSALGQPLEQPTSFVVGAALNLEAPDMDRELRLLERKVDAGADFFLTQPVYRAEAVERWRQRLGSFPRPVILGVLPLRSIRHAEFLHNEVPGIVVPREVRSRLRKAGSAQAEVGLEICRDLLREVKGSIHGAYVMPPFGRYQIVGELLEGLADDIPGLGEGAEAATG